MRRGETSIPLPRADNNANVLAALESTSMKFDPVIQTACLFSLFPPLTVAVAGGIQFELLISVSAHFNAQRAKQ